MSGTPIYELEINRRTQNVKGLLKQGMEFIVNPGGDIESPRTIVVDMLAGSSVASDSPDCGPRCKDSIQQFGDVADLLMDFVLWLRDRDVRAAGLHVGEGLE